MKEWIKQEKTEKLSVKWDRWQSTDKEERGKEKEQKEESCMMQTCDKTLQKRGKAAASQC